MNRFLTALILSSSLAVASDAPVSAQPQADLFNIFVVPSPVVSGGALSVSCTLALTEKLEKECFLFLHLEGASPQAYVNADVQLPVPVRYWQPQAKVDLGPFFISIPVDLPEGEYRLTMGLSYAEDTPLGTRYVKIPYRNRQFNNWTVAKIVVRKRPYCLESSYQSQECRIAIAGPLEKIFPEKKYCILDDDRKKETVSLSAAQGEYESFQIVLIPGANDLHNVKVDIGDLHSKENDAMIPREQVAVFKVGYVETKKPYYNTARVGSWPDPLVPLEDGLTVKNDSVQPLWITVYIPYRSPAGIYSGTIAIQTSEKVSQKISLRVKVRDFSIPERSSLKTAFDLYEYLIRMRYPKRQEETESQWRLRIESVLEKHYLDMLKHRISPIHNVRNPELKGSQNRDYILDFEEFDKKAEFYLARGQTCFGIAKEWPSGDTGTWSDVWYGYTSADAAVGVFRSYGRHLEEKGWLDISYAYIFDETFLRVKEFTSLVHQGHQGIKNLVTMIPEDGYPDVDIWCVRINNFSRPIIGEFKAKGKEIWMYVAGTTRPFPNLNLDVPALEHRIIPWMCWKYNVNGLLYWCVNFWHTTNPWEDPMTIREQNGVGSLYYPDPREESFIGSLRLEVLRDGLEDYEYLALLARRLKEVKEKGLAGSCPEAVKEAEIITAVDKRIVESMAYYTRDNKAILEEREKMGDLIETIGLVLTRNTAP